MRTSTHTHASNIIQCSSIRKIVSKLRWHINYCIHAVFRTKRVRINFHNEIRTRKTVMRPKALWFHLFELLIFSTAINILSFTLFALSQGMRLHFKWFKFFRFFSRTSRKLMWSVPCKALVVRPTVYGWIAFLWLILFFVLFIYSICVLYIYIWCELWLSKLILFFLKFHSNKPFLFSGNQLRSLCLVGICLFDWCFLCVVTGISLHSQTWALSRLAPFRGH